MVLNFCKWWYLNFQWTSAVVCNRGRWASKSFPSRCVAVRVCCELKLSRLSKFLMNFMWVKKIMNLHGIKHEISSYFMLVKGATADRFWSINCCPAPLLFCCYWNMSVSKGIQGRKLSLAQFPSLNHLPNMVNNTPLNPIIKILSCC